MLTRRSITRIPVINRSAILINLCGINVLAFQMELTLDDPEVYHNGPVAVQLVGRRLREEQVLEMAETLANALKK